MKARHWWIFGGIQVAGALVGMGASHVDILSWGLSIVLLLPGILVSSLFFSPGNIGNNWPKWSIFAIAIAANILLLKIATFVFAKRRKNKLSAN